MEPYCQVLPKMFKLKIEMWSSYLCFGSWINYSVKIVSFGFICCLDYSFELKNTFKVNVSSYALPT